MEFEEIQKDQKRRLSSKRYIHVLGVTEAAGRLADRYGADREKARLAGLVHDCAKEFTLEEMQDIMKRSGHIPDDRLMRSKALLHGPAGSVLAQERYGITSPDILSAVYYHTTGRENMSLMEKIIFLADYIEPSRKFPGVDDIRKVAFSSLDEAVLLGYDKTIRYLLDSHQYIYDLTFRGRNDLIISSNC